MLVWGFVKLGGAFGLFGYHPLLWHKRPYLRKNGGLQRTTEKGIVVDLSAAARRSAEAIRNQRKRSADWTLVLLNLGLGVRDSGVAV